MCGIVGYIGEKNALPILLQGLRKLEYRGYDSAGIAVLGKGKVNRTRSVGKIEDLAGKINETEMAGTSGIAHTRWATHGGVTEENAHPHLALSGKLVLVHNGIIENYRELKSQLEGKVKFESDTDSEVLAHFIAANFRGDLFEAVQRSLPHVRGTYGILAMHADHPEYMVAARLGSPLVIGIGEKEYYTASDVTPIMPYTKKVMYMDDGEIARIDRGGVKIENLTNEEVEKGVEEIDWDEEAAQKSGYPHFMLKEIFDQPLVYEDAIRGRIDMEEGTAHLGGLNMDEDEMRSVKRVVIIACGTAGHAGEIGKYAFERLAGIPTDVEISSEFRYRDPVVDHNTLVFALSQSGETADTLMALREAKRKGAKVRGIINVVGSSIAREAGAGTYIHAGPELAVASTKAYTNMTAILLLYALQFGRLKHTTLATGQRLLGAMLEIPKKLNLVLEQNEHIKEIAQKYKDSEHLFFLGRGVNFPVAQEGSLKLKEISYIYSEAYPGGEMKHGPLALISKDFPVVALCTKNQLYEKMKSNIEEAKARGARILAIATARDEEIKQLADDVIYVPPTMELLEPILNTVPLQLLAYHIAVALGRDVDRPRNLAKSVTVE
jgi:glucosamine--fructose-6-phosphate aminotransferase (isomerizing)